MVKKYFLICLLTISPLGAIYVAGQSIDLLRDYLPLDKNTSITIPLFARNTVN
ncbi:hypothetical protein [uncultured Bacteroides sp.]|uniref:hypothetical protein n=1 Tax=uncultured Bacteroides sp. TaxID=162156 RepID=UPI0037482B56